LTERLKASSIFSFSDVETIKLDFDDASFRDVKYWVPRTMKWFKLKGFVIPKTSATYYHVVFDRRTSWSENMHVVTWVALLSHNKGLAKWFLMQCIKGCSTLQVSSKREKPPPRVVCKSGEQNENVKDS
jgi:hypothetical protein